MATPFSHHALLLPAGANLLNQNQSDATIQVDHPDDYLTRRHDFWKKDPSSRTSKIVEDLPVSLPGAIKDVMNPLRQVSSQIEIAMALCCERIPKQSVPVDPPRSTKRITPPSQTSNSDVDAPTSNHGATNSGVLREGKEGYFLKLLSMNCPKHAVGNRALAIAILQRTVDWEKYTVVGDSALENVSFAGIPGTMDEQHSRNSIMPSTRTKSFLAAGGMKLLSRWLVDSFTVVSDSSYNNKKSTTSHGGTLHVASPTGCLLLPLLELLEVIPFDKKLIVASNINKSIKRLKKALNIVADGLDPATLEEATHPIAGGLSVGKVIAATDAVMASWTKASTVNAKDEAPFKFDAFDHLRKKIRLRYDTLVKFRHEQGNIPIRSISAYLKTMPDSTNNSATESSQEFLSRSFPTSQLLRNVTSSTDKQGALLGLQTNMEPNKGDDPGLPRKRKAVDDVRRGSMRQVSWNDQTMMNSMPSGSGPGNDETPWSDVRHSRVKREGNDETPWAGAGDQGRTPMSQEYSTTRVKEEGDSF
ncbi:hypothetical protein ACHAWU_003947 [Discostella pseudostelligera]|uniref:Uncharacterized protein n=1 Tax=Discostella pseudostelligera TaxID=259834 RepID=A0ABD3MJ75_9STRA